MNIKIITIALSINLVEGVFMAIQLDTKYKYYNIYLHQPLII